MQKKHIHSVGDELKHLEQVSGKIAHDAFRLRDSAFKRFPIVFSLLSSFGLVATFYGFEKVIDQVPLFERHPWLILAAGLLILIGTGALYKKLNH